MKPGTNEIRQALIPADKILAVRAELIRKGMTFRGFARKLGMSEDTVCAVVLRYGRGIHKAPNGVKTTRILAAIEAETGISLIGNGQETATN